MKVLLHKHELDAMLMAMVGNATDQLKICIAMQLAVLGSFVESAMKPSAMA